MITTSRSLLYPQFVSALSALFAANVAAAQTPKLDPPVKSTVTGKFAGNGKMAAMKFVRVEEHEPFSGKEAITLIFSEKDPAAAKKPSFDAMFGKLGSALIVNVHHDGGIFGCQVVHTAHQKQGFSSIGKIKTTEFKLAGGNVSGNVSTGGELDTFGEKWEVDLKFAAPLPAKLRTAVIANDSNSLSDATKAVTNEPAGFAKNEAKQARGPLIAARKLPLPKDATNLEYKAAVNQIHLRSARPVEVVARELSANLKQQGWQDSPGSLMGSQNAILRREHGAAKLTIMVQPSGTGSSVKIFTEGLDWSGAGDTTPPRNATVAPNARDLEAEAQKLLNEALKNLPKGL